MMKQILIAGVFLVGLYSGADAETYHISKTGSDANSGTSWNQAWLTLTNVNDTSEFHGGDSVIIGAGRWREELYMVRGGTGTNKTYYIDSAWVAGTEDHRVAWIYGSDTLDNWTLVSGNVYKCSYTPGFMDEEVGIWQGDSILLRQVNSGDVDAPGESWYGSNEIYAYVYDSGSVGYDPDNYQMEIGQRKCVVYTPELESGSGNKGFSADNWVLQGLGFKYSHGHQLTTNNTGRDELGFDSSIISHCYFACNSGNKDENPSLVYTPLCGNTGEYDPWNSVSADWLDGADYNRITACSLGMNYGFSSVLPQKEHLNNGGGMNFYSWRYSVIDSNIFWGSLGEDGAIKFKSWFTADSGGVQYDTIRFNTFDCASTALIYAWSAYHLVIYGNTFHNTQDFDYSMGFFMKPSSLGMPWSGHHEIYNNTFYDTREYTVNVTSEDDPDKPARENKFKYNIIYQKSPTRVMRFDNTAFWIDVDSNMYYTETGTNTWNSDETTVYDFEGWQGIGYDVHGSDDVDPGFADAEAGDFSRPGASAEMSKDYDGWTATIYGAVQTAETTPKIGVTPSQLNFAMGTGDGAPPSQTLQIFNTGIGVLNWQVTDNAAWLDLTPSSGTNTGGVTVSVDPLTDGTYTADITITAAGADNSPLVVPVNYAVTEPDNEAPIITFGIDSSLATAFSNTIVWVTDEPATSQVEYGLSAAYGSLSPLDQTLVTDHSVSLTGLTPDTVYHFRVISRDASNNEAMSQDSTFRTPVQPDNLALNRPVTVSGTYAGYSSSVICDGVIDPYGGTSTTWASDEGADHWVEIDLEQTVPVSSVRICWALNEYSSQWMRSQLLTIQGWDGNSWSDLATVDNIVSEVITYPDTVITYDPETGDPNGFFVDWTPPGDDITISAAGFNAITLSRIRILQEGGMGSVSYPSIMWLTEIEVYTADITPPTSKI